MNLHLLIVTDGRNGYLERTLSSIPTAVWASVSSTTAIENSGSQSHCSWLQQRLPHAEVCCFDRKLGFGGAIQAGWSKVPAAATHVLHLEDDFLFETAVDVEWMAATLDANPHLAQLVLKRQAWNDEEKEAGGIVECWPDLYEEVEASGGWYTQHRLYFSTNPCMYRRELTERGWPDGPHSERTFTDQLLEDPATRFAFVGGKFDPPAVTHIGAHRAGVGY
jgi:hypothetical protein